LAVKVTLPVPAFADERRDAAGAAAPLLLGAQRLRRRSMSTARMALSSKPAARRDCSRMIGQTD